MTRKHFQAFAQALLSSQPELRELGAFAQWQADVAQVAITCSQFNANFDKIKFMSACDFDGRKQVEQATT